MANAEPDKVIKITLDSKGLPVPDQDPILVRKDNQKIRWCAEFDFTIAIEGYSDVKHGKGGDSPFSAKTGCFTSPVGTRHKYAITANGNTNDPDIDIKP